MNKLKVIIEKGKAHYSAYVSEGLKHHAINGQGQTREDAITDLKVALKELREMYIDNAEVIPEEIRDVSFEYSMS